MSGGGGKGSPGVITLMNPGPYRPLYLWGWLVGGCQTNRPLPRGGSSRPMVARLVRYGPVRQKITFLNESPPFSLELYSESPPLCNTRPLRDGPVANFRRITIMRTRDSWRDCERAAHVPHRFARLSPLSDYPLSCLNKTTCFNADHHVSFSEATIGFSTPVCRSCSFVVSVVSSSSFRTFVLRLPPYYM